MPSLVRMPPDAVKTVVAEVLPPFSQVAGAYHFGSSLGPCRPDSDIDIGLVIFPRATEPSGRGFSGLEARVEMALGKIDGHTCDVTVLRTDQILFSFKVIREGRLVYCRDRDAVFDFVERVSRRHSDVAYRHFQAVREVLA